MKAGDTYVGSSMLICLTPLTFSLSSRAALRYFDSAKPPTRINDLIYVSIYGTMKRDMILTHFEPAGTVHDVFDAGGDGSNW